MQLKLQRSQQTRGVTSSTVFFCLDVRADYTPEEKSNINKYKLGPQTIYNSRAAQKHLEAAGAHLDRTQEGPTGNRVLGLVRGATSLAMANMQLSISIASLGRGHHVECKDLEELLESEDTIRTACKNLTRYLEVASTFDGSELVVEYVNGEEKVHVAQDAPPLLEYDGDPDPANGHSALTSSDSAYEFSAQQPTLDGDALVKFARRHWNEFRAFDGRVQAALGLGAALVAILLLRACS
jgi:hypothetical protein